MNRKGIFYLDAILGGAAPGPFMNAFVKPLERFLGFPLLNECYVTIEHHDTAEYFFPKVLDVLNIGYRVADEDLGRVPKEGPVVVVANHPYGMVEGVILGALLTRVRSDVKMMGTRFLSFIPNIRDMIISVDNLGGDAAPRVNIRPLKESLRCLRDGRLLAIFPAGEVSSPDLRKRRISDPPWTPMVARIIHKTGAPVLPVFFHGRNSSFFQIMGMVHPRLRTLLLPREFVNMQRRTVGVSIGHIIPYKKIEHLAEEELMRYLRLRTYILHQRDVQRERRRFWFWPVGAAHRPPQGQTQRYAAPVEDAAPTEALAEEIARLEPWSLLLESGEFGVYATRAELMPRVLKEIGRLREITFRLVGEGTGKQSDLDRFDAHYDHLFIWNKKAQEIVGAYRIGRTDEIITRDGLEGLYTSTLFTFKPALFERMGRALEMGRSFVRPEYQKSYAPLLLLWKGIGRYLMREPEYTVLFGPVSISNEYSSLSRELLVRYFKAHNSISSLARLVKPKTPPKLKSLKRHEIREFRNVFTNLEDVTEALSDIENEFRGIPVLLRQYLKLGGKILAFNVDHEFGDCLDGLIMVDMLQSNPKVLTTYFGKGNVELYHKYHSFARAKSPLEGSDAEK